MEPRNQERLDALLDRALAEYGKADPRPGLENRVLANLDGERERAARRRWRWALGMAGAAAAVVLAVWVGNGMRKPLLPASGANTVSPIVREIAAAKSSGPVDVRPAVKPSRHVSNGRPQEGVEVAVTPKLEQFPSPMPLSEQEKLLARCVNEFPKEAVMMAKAQAEWQREAGEESQPKWWERNSEDSRK